MKKTFPLTVPNKKQANHLDSIKHEVKKYITRERKKKLPEGVDFWDFDCRIGFDQESAKEIHVAEVNKKIVETAESATDQESFYLEILAKQATRQKKSK